MIRVKADEAVYRDIEKFYRVLGYYHGQELKPLEIHQKFIDENLETELRQSTEYIRRFNYHFMMTDVLSEGHVVYKTEKPATSLVYTLFSEGILALIALRELCAQDIKDWCSVVHETMVAFDQGSPKDLASTLWRSPSRNLRTRVYTSLMDLEASLAERRKRDKSSKAVDVVAAPTEWHERDQEWVLPDGESVQRQESASVAIDPKVVKSFKSQMLTGSTITTRLPPDLQVDPEDLFRISEELSSYDPNHVEFNLLNWAFNRLHTVSTSETHARAFAIQVLEELALSIVTRFQPSLLIFLLAELKNLKEGALADVRRKIESKITETLQDPSNERRLLASLADIERAQVTKRLLPFLEPKQFPIIVDFYLKHDDKDGLVSFLETVLLRAIDHEALFLSWGAERLAQVLPLFRRLMWPKKYEFLKRALKSPSPKVCRAASYYLINIQIDSASAMQIYSKLDDELREVWIRVLSENPPKEYWGRFVAEMVKTGLWTKGQDPSHQNRKMLGWAELAFRYFGTKALELMRPYLKTRHWLLWPKFPKEREAVLSALLSARELHKEQATTETVRSEAKLQFQDADLRTRLKAFLSKEDQK